MKENTKGCYIPSIEAEEIYDMSVRGLENVMKYDYVGQIPYSLELIKLRSFKRPFSEKPIEKNSKVKYQSDAIINVKFKNKIKAGKEITSFVRGYDNLMNRLNMQFESLDKAINDKKSAIEKSVNKREIDKLKKSQNYLENKRKLLQGHIERIQGDKDNDIYQEMKAPELRNYLYTKGITFKNRHYRFYKRTASKSRQSQALFILDELYDKMKEWSHMGLDLSGKIDVASLLAYESLVSSSLESTIEINPKNIFIIDDKFSEFELPAIEVENDLKAVPNEKAVIKNNIWDGQGLMDKSLFESIGKSDKGMALLRQHFFKSCMFNTNIQNFLQDNCPDDIPYKEWKLTDMFNNKVAAKDIFLITTPSSLKFLKYAKGNKKKAYAKWIKHVKKDGNTFGICKHEKSSKYGDRSLTSYQMINTLDANEDDIKALAEFEHEFIKDLQGRKVDDGVYDEMPYINYLNKNKELTNAYEMLYEMYRINPEIARTKMFRDYRTKQISNYRTKIKGGKLRLEADYCTVVSNPYEMLESLIEGKRSSNKINKSSVLSGNEIYTTLHPFNEEYTLVRNPHNAMNNFVKATNVHNELLDDYFNFTNNIVVINSINSPILDRLNGMDMDSDTTLIFSDREFNRVIDKTLHKRNYPIILNKIQSKPNPVEFTEENIARIDEKTAKSQKWIGQVTNAAQFQVSVLWDVKNNDKEGQEKEDKIKDILSNVAVLVVLSNVAIDYSKKIVEVDVDKALREIRSSNAVKVLDSKRLRSRKKPKFWKYVTSGDSESVEYDCPMDLLINHINGIEKSNYRKNLSLNDLLIEMPREERVEADSKQIGDIMKLVKEFDKRIKETNSVESSDKKCQERMTLIEDAYNSLDDKISKKKVKKVTMYKLLSLVAQCYDEKLSKRDKSNDYSNVAVHLLNALYRNHKTTFLNLMKK
jgi:hypothetical protein